MKKIKILIISLIIILVLGCATYAVLYFTTDIFKSNKKGFNEYIAKMDLKDFINLENFNSNTKTNSEKYLTEGNISLNITNGEETKEETINYSFNVDSINKKSNGDINIVIDGENGLNLKYLQNGDLYGVEFKDIEQIANQYIVLENNNLKEFASKLNLTDDDVDFDIPDKIEIPEQTTQIMDSINIDELKQIFSKYLNIALEQIPEENYSKVKKQNIEVNNETIEADGYSVKITSKDISNILNKILETMKNDEQIFNIINKINQEISFEQYQEAIDDILQNITVENETNEMINITVYKSGKNTVKIQAVLNEKYEISIEKTKINLTFENDEIGNASLSFSKNAEQEYSLVANVVEEDMNADFTFNIKTTIDPSIEIEDFKEGEYALINEYTGEQINNLFGNIAKLLVDNTNIENEFLTPVGISMQLKGGLFDKASSAVEETKKRQIYEAIMLAESDIIANYYENNTTLNISEQQIKEKIEEYLPSDYVINVTKTEGKEEYVVTSDGIDLDETRNKIDLTSLVNN